MSDSSTAPGCEGCQWRMAKDDPGFNSLWCHQFPGAPANLPCAQHDCFAVEREVTSALIRRNPALLTGMVLAEMASQSMDPTGAADLRAALADKSDLVSSSQAAADPRAVLDESDGWKPDYTKTPRRVVCAANRCRRTGLIVCGARHWNKTMHAVFRQLGGDFRDSEQGFSDQFGDFMTREEAWIVAVDQNQIRREVSAPGTLFSENLY